MNARIERLRRASFETEPCISAERALLVTRFYQQYLGKYPTPILRARLFKALCQQQTLYIGDDELIVGERGPSPKAVSTYPELTCHSVEDLAILNARTMTRYHVSEEVLEAYREHIIPYWEGRTLREIIFSDVPDNWQRAYTAGMFTEFMEQRAPGHTSLDDTIYHKGLLDLKADIDAHLARLDFLNDPMATDKSNALQAMAIACEGVIIFSERHALLAEQMAAQMAPSPRRDELMQIAEVCRRVPAHAPRNLWEALQMYWFVHLGTIMELNGWDAMSPGRLDQHLYPFYRRALREGALTREAAKELIACLWIKFNNHPAPPKVGITALESGTYNDFTNINLGGLTREGADGVNDVSYLLLEIIDELHLLQPGSNIQVSRKTPNRFIKAAAKVIRRGYGYPSVFNADGVVLQQVRTGKSLEDARQGGCSGCIETGCFGKEAYVLTGYLNVPKILSLALNQGRDSQTGIAIGAATEDPRAFTDFDALYDAFEQQLKAIVDLKISVNNYIEKMYARHMPAPFLSAVIQDCIAKGRDYYDGGPRYNTTFIQCCGIGTITDSLAAFKQHVYDERTITMDTLLKALEDNFEGQEVLRQRLLNQTACFGNDNPLADGIMQRVYASLLDSIEGRPNTKGGQYHLNMLSTTCHVYFGKKLGATANGRLAGTPISDGTSPSHGADRHGPTAVIKSLGKMDQTKSCGTLLNQRFLPSVLADEAGLAGLVHLVRTYFNLNGHHIQFNVVDTATLRHAQQHPDQYRDLLVRVAGYSDYFVDLDQDHQEEIIARTEHDAF